MTPARVAPILAVLGFVSLVAGCSGAGEQVSCAPNPCTESARTRCEMDGSVARCLCDTGYVEINGACISSAACIPNPCTAPYQTTCIPEGPSAAAICVCDPGHAPAGTGCDPFPIFDCGVAHTTGFPDAWEPDECPSKATEVLISSIWTDGHTLNPTGDVDWFRFEGMANHIYELRATSDDVELYADAYAADGVSALGADHRGTKAVAIWFKSPSDDALYARIQALRGNATGPYRVQITDIGMDDFADVTVAALSIAADTKITGELQFDADRDVLKLPFQGGIAYAVTFEFFGVGTPLFELVAADGVTVTQKLSGANVGIVTRSPGAGAVFLRVSGLTTNTLGPFAITTATLGPDDHGDVPAEATPIVPGSSPIAVSIDRASDVDVISFDAVAPNIYAFSCATISGSGSLRYTLTNESGAVLAQYTTWNSSSFAQEASESGKRFVHVRSEFPSTMKLSCKLQNLGLDDHGDTIAEATPIVADAGVSAGRLETADDKDVFSFTAIAAHVYRFQCNAPASGSCSVRFLSSSGAELTSGSSVAWEVSTAGTYYVEVGSGYSTQAASYTFALEDLGADDHGDTFATATAIGTGALGGAALETLVDKDVFSFQALSQHIYRFTCTTTGPGCMLKVFGPSGVLLAQAESYYYYSSGAMVAYEVAVAGTYYVEVSIGSMYGSAVTSYSYGLEDLGVDDYGDDVLTATSVLVGDGGTATLEFAGEVDAFKFTPTAGRVYRLECTRGTLTSCDLQLKDAIGGTLYSVSNPSHGEIVFEATSENPVVFTVGWISSYSKPEGTYTWSITDVGTDDHGDTPATATPALLPMTAQGAQLESFGDVDVFAFAATAGHIYRVTCTGGTLPNCMKRVKDGAGNLIAEQSYWTPNAPFVATTSATYYVEISSDRSYYGNAVGTYSWLIEEVGVDDHGDTLASATDIAAGPPGTAGNLQFRDDVDVFSFDASAGRIYVARCVAGSANNCYVTISDASGASLASGQNSAGYEASTAQTLFVEVSVYYYGEMGSYTIVVDDLGADDHGDTYQTATAIPALGNSVNGVIELYGDVDYFSILLAANTTYSATVIGNYVEVGVYSTNGSFLSSQTFTTTSAGTYYVGVASWYGGLNNPYTLELQLVGATN
jgi:hypothetical protein